MVLYFCVFFMVFAGMITGAIPPVDPFNCPALSTPAPSNHVDRLKPGNVDVVMMLGDSISAAFGAQSGEIWEPWTLLEYRGSAYAMGGDPGAYSVANFLKFYNPNLQGYSVGNSLPLDVLKWPFGNGSLVQPFDPSISFLNAAESGAHVQRLSVQIDYLVHQLKTTFAGRVDYENSWKMVFLLMGANNLCSACLGDAGDSADTYEALVDAAIQKIYEQIPRVRVNLISQFNISNSGVYRFGQMYEYCRFMWTDVMPGECGCMMTGTDADREAMDAAALAYRKRLEVLEQKWAHKSVNFTVVVQPFASALEVPTEGTLSDFDCFHPNQIAHQHFALGLWNNLLTPVGQKKTSVNFSDKLLCPTEQSFIQ